jgi:hypothetical protein
VKPEGARASKLRGGSWINNINNCRSACRNHNRFDAINNNIGFRLVVSARALQCRSRRVGIRRERKEESSARSGDAERCSTAFEHPKIKRGAAVW